MKARLRLERVLKDLHVLAELSRRGMVGESRLDEKVSLCRTEKDLWEARRLTLRNVYAIEDAEESAKNTVQCGECATVYQKEYTQ